MRKYVKYPQLFRRSAAMLLAMLGIWVLVLCTGAGQAESGRWQQSLFAETLAMELGSYTPAEPGEKQFTVLDRLLLRQSSLLWHNRGVMGSEATVRKPEPVIPDLPAEAETEDCGETECSPVTTAAPENIVAQTLAPSQFRRYETADGLYLYNCSNETVDFAKAAGAPVELRLPAQEPQILIIHTHGTEAYTPDADDVYEPSDKNTRTTDERYNVLRVGDEMEKVFTELGLNVLHDRTLYDYPKYAGCYTRSRAGVEQYLKQYPSLRIILDVHRDALVDKKGTVYKALTNIDGVPAAQVMLVVGADGDKDGIHPNWMKNLTLAAKLQKSMDTLYPTLARPMTMRKSHYNQQLSPGSLLVEVGCHGNTLQEALAGARLFARASGQVLLGLVA